MIKEICRLYAQSIRHCATVLNHEEKHTDTDNEAKQQQQKHK